jgi:hypothetical protein
MPGIERARAERTETSSGLARIAERLAGDLLDRFQRLRPPGLPELVRIGPLVGSSGADLGGDGEARRHRQAQLRHLGQVGALAAQQVRRAPLSFFSSARTMLAARP